MRLILYVLVILFAGCKTTNTLEAINTDNPDVISVGFIQSNQRDAIACIQENAAQGPPTGWPSGGLALSRMELKDRVRLFTLNNFMLFDVFPQSEDGRVKVKAVIHDFSAGNILRYVFKQCTQSHTIANEHKK